MADKLYDMMDWAEIEAVQYSEEKYPRNILGPRVTPEGILIQCFFPEEEKVSLRTLSDRKLHAMTEEDGGYFAILLPGKKIPRYTFVLGIKRRAERSMTPMPFPPRLRRRRRRVSRRASVMTSMRNWEPIP